MLPLIVFGIAQTSGLAADTPAQVKGLLDSMGYAFTPIGSVGDYGKIVRRKTEVTVVMFYSTKEGEGASAVAAIQLSIELAFPREVRLEEVGLLDQIRLSQMPILDFRYEGTSATAFIPHIGSTVTVTKRIDLRHGLTRERLRNDLAAFWKDGEVYAGAHQGSFENFRPTDWSKTKLDDDLSLNFADEISLRRATDSWGWPKRGWAGSSNGWLFLFDIQGATFCVREAARSSLPKNRSFYLSGNFTPLNPKEASDLEKSVAWARIAPYGDGRYEVLTEIDLKGGVKLGELRRRIKEFADKVAILKRESSPLTSPNSNERS